MIQIVGGTKFIKGDHLFLVNEGGPHLSKGDRLAGGDFFFWGGGGGPIVT